MSGEKQHRENFDRLTIITNEGDGDSIIFSTPTKRKSAKKVLIDWAPRWGGGSKAGK